MGADGSGDTAGVAADVAAEPGARGRRREAATLAAIDAELTTRLAPTERGVARRAQLGP